MIEGSVKGRAVLEALVKRFPQLYVAPAEGAQDAHKRASTLGIAPDNASLCPRTVIPRRYASCDFCRLSAVHGGT